MKVKINGHDIKVDRRDVRNLRKAKCVYFDRIQQSLLAADPKCNNGQKRKMRMARYLLAASGNSLDGKAVYLKNGDPFDLRRSNILVTKKRGCQTKSQRHKLSIIRTREIRWAK